MTTTQTQSLVESSPCDVAIAVVGAVATVVVVVLDVVAFVLLDVLVDVAKLVNVGGGTMMTAGRVVVVADLVVVVGRNVVVVVDSRAIVEVVRAGRLGRGCDVDGAGSVVAVVDALAPVVGALTTGRLTVGREPLPPPPDPHAAIAIAAISTQTSRRDLPRCVTTRRRVRRRPGTDSCRGRGRSPSPP